MSRISRETRVHRNPNSNAEMILHYRQRAEEIRNVADGVIEAKARKILIEVAEEFEQLAGILRASMDTEMSLEGTAQLPNKR